MRRAAMALAVVLSSWTAACGEHHGRSGGEQGAAQSVACGIHRVLSELRSVQRATSAGDGAPPDPKGTLITLEGRAARVEHDVLDLSDATGGRQALLEAAHRTRLAAHLLLRRRSGPATAALQDADARLNEGAMALWGSTPPRVGGCTWPARSG